MRFRISRRSVVALIALAAIILALFEALYVLPSTFVYFFLAVGKITDGMNVELAIAVLGIGYAAVAASLVTMFAAWTVIRLGRRPRTRAARVPVDLLLWACSAVAFVSIGPERGMKVLFLVSLLFIFVNTVLIPDKPNSKTNQPAA